MAHNTRRWCNQCVEFWSMTLCNHFMSFDLSLGRSQRWIFLYVSFVALSALMLELPLLSSLFLWERPFWPVPISNYQLTSPQLAGPEMMKQCLAKGSSEWSCDYPCSSPQWAQCLPLAVACSSLPFPHPLSLFAVYLNHRAVCTVAVCHTRLGGPPQTEPSSALLDHSESVFTL